MATRKAQVVFFEDQYGLLGAYAREQGKTVSALVRESLERTLLAELQQRRRRAALDRLFSLELPVADWEMMERELEGRWSDHEPA